MDIASVVSAQDTVSFAATGGATIVTEGGVFDDLDDPFWTMTTRKTRIKEIRQLDDVEAYGNIDVASQKTGEEAGGVGETAALVALDLKDDVKTEAGTAGREERGGADAPQLRHW